MFKGKRALIFVIALCIVAIIIDLPKIPSIKILNKTLSFEIPLKLGLDLQGGTQLVLETDMSKIKQEDKDSALESARNVIEKRVNLYGVSEALVQASKLKDQRRILIELPGLKDSTAAASLVGKTAQLQFREATVSAVLEENQATPSAKIDFVATNLTGADLKKAQVVFASGNSTKSGPEISIEFTTDGSKKFAEITKRNIGRPLAIFLDETMVSAPTVQQEIIGGNAVITGQFSSQEAKDLAVQLNAGALPVPIKIIEQRSIGPTLGFESVNKSLIAGIIGLSIVAFYMAIYYGWLGVIADIALIIYAILTLSIFKTGFFILPPITLTLAGIAGFILSIGMAVDANILIFERMKEEMRWGKPKKIALELGFKRAWSAIFASNISSLITAMILYSIGTSLVKGFSVTLAIGVLVSMFTAIFVTRTILRLFVK